MIMTDTWEWKLLRDIEWTPGVWHANLSRTFPCLCAIVAVPLRKRRCISRCARTEFREIEGETRKQWRRIPDPQRYQLFDKVRKVMPVFTFISLVSFAREKKFRASQNNARKKNFIIEI